MSRIVDAIKDEPALILGAVQAAVALVVAFGVHLSEVQIGALFAFVAAVFAVIVRSRVTPVP